MPGSGAARMPSTSPVMMAALRPTNISMGLMLETTSRRLREKGGPHFHAPDKEPATRIRTYRSPLDLLLPASAPAEGLRTTVTDAGGKVVFQSGDPVGVQFVDARGDSISFL